MLRIRKKKRFERNHWNGVQDAQFGGFLFNFTLSSSLFPLPPLPCPSLSLSLSLLFLHLIEKRICMEIAGAWRVSFRIVFSPTASRISVGICLKVAWILWRSKHIFLFGVFSRTSFGRDNRLHILDGFEKMLKLAKINNWKSKQNATTDSSSIFFSVRRSANARNEYCFRPFRFWILIHIQADIDTLCKPFACHS